MIVLSEEKLIKKKIRFKIQKLLNKKSSNFKQIVESCDVEKIMVSKYLKELIDEGNVVLKRKRKQGIEKYGLSENGKKSIMILLEKQKIKSLIDQMSPEKFQNFKNFLVFMIKSKKGEELYLPVSDETHNIKKFKNLGN